MASADRHALITGSSRGIGRGGRLDVFVSNARPEVLAFLGQALPLTGRVYETND